MTDPTYNRKNIDANPVWYLAFVISEIKNDNAPIGWGQYITLAEGLLDNFDIKRKEK